MCTRVAAPASMLLLALALALPGCHAYRPVTIEVVDAETDAPIEGAVGRIDQVPQFEAFGPQDSTATAGPDGVLELRATDRPFVQLFVQAPGYVAFDALIAEPFADAVIDTSEVSTVEAIGDRAWRIGLFSGDRAHVELVVPAGFRGPIFPRYGGPLEDADGPLRPRQRRFRVLVADDRTAILPAARILDIGHTFSAVDERGRPIAGPAETWTDTEPLRSTWRFRGLDGVPRADVFVVGTRGEYEHVLGTLYAP